MWRVQGDGGAQDPPLGQENRCTSCTMSNMCSPPAMKPMGACRSHMKILVTGAAGFIGFFVSQGLLARGDEVVGLDNLNDYYDPRLKLSRLKLLQDHAKFRFVKLDLGDRKGIEGLFAAQGFDRVIHLAAQAGVRNSIENPHIYVDSNVTGFLHIIEGCRHSAVEHLVYASTSSVYGANTHMPFAVDQNVDHPLTLYAATKKANELMAHSYSSLYGLPTTGLRFFTVYGPWGRHGTWRCSSSRPTSSRASRSMFSITANISA